MELRVQAEGANQTKIVGLPYVSSNQSAHILASHGSIPDATTFILFQHLYQGVSIMVCQERNNLIGKRNPQKYRWSQELCVMFRGFSLARWNIDSVNYLACLIGYVSQIPWSLLV